ncbi:hypothetical protein [Methylicorpusculum sp.]|uniref:hypothetical protein n=1 Tax=Methylicorpusculum sp. TaxID=2713644 RepID=UPI0027256CA4|nr:hypothetical protein [Methylicorpusculum sp.]MDO8844991.1 hypothetical protein [Methylicorpusculum sp.]
MTISLQKSVLSAIGGLALLFNTGTALSASSASASIDWSTFTIATLGLDGYSFSDEWTNVYADAWPNSDWNWADDWISPISASVQGASAVADASQLFASADSSDGFSYASTTRGATFEVVGAGWLLFSADYVISAAKDGHPDDYADASVSFWAYIDSQNGGESSSSYSSVSVGDWLGSANESSKSKKLGLALLVNEGDIIHFNAYASAYASNVPVPAAVWFFGSALVGLISYGRRKTTG